MFSSRQAKEAQLTIDQLLFNRRITQQERKDLADLDTRSAIVALILKVESVFRLEVKMDDAELARTLGFALAEAGPDPQLYKDVTTRPLVQVLEQRMMTPEFNARVVRFMREYFEYDKAPGVFKDSKDLPKARVSRLNPYQPLWYVDDADHFCLNIIRKDQDVLKQLLTSNRYSIRGTLNTTHLKPLKRAAENFYNYGYYETYGLLEGNGSRQVSPWRAEYLMKNRIGLLHHPAWL